MTVHKLTAGDGYTYLTRQVAAHDATSLDRQGLGAYYSEKGETPGIWMGRGMDAVPGFPVGQYVTEANMKALFGEGRHPNADQIERDLIRAGTHPWVLDEATRLGAPYLVYEDTNEFRKRCAQAFADRNAAAGLPGDWPVHPDVRAEIRTQIARTMFIEQYGRDPADARELSGHLNRISRQATTAVAGYDLTFSPVKSVSTLWAVAPKEVADIIEQAHHDAVKDTLTWIEDNATYTRVGRHGVAQVDTRGLIAAAFTHRDSRAGDPDLHSHVAISNKVQTLSGRWLALDGRLIYRSNVAASERYNTRLEALLIDRLGVQFADRPGDDPAKRPIREIVGVDGELPRTWSRRRAAIDVKRAELSAQFQRDHGRPPTPKEALALAQQANLETRQRKHAPRSHADQRATWREEAVRVLGGETQLGRYVSTALRTRADRRRAQRQAPTPTPAWVATTADNVLAIVSEQRATWQPTHIRAEAERQVRAAGIRLVDLDRAVTALTREALAPARSVALTSHDGIAEPELLRRSDGASVYTTAGAALYTSPTILTAERAILTAAAQRGGRTITSEAIDLQLVESAANGITLNPGQEQLVRELATSGRRVQLALAPAGTGKTTAMRVLSRAWTDSGGTVIGLAPSAAAAAVLREEIRTDTDTLAKLVWHLASPDNAPEWMAHIGPDTLVVIDEAGMASTADLADAIEHITSRGGSVRLIGDDQQLAAIGAGGVLRDIATDHGAVTLSQVMRFTNRDTGAPNHAEGAASLALRDGDTAGIAYYLDHGRVHVGDLTTCTDDAYAAWSADRAAGFDSIMLAPTRDLVAELNNRARADRITAGEVNPARPVRLADNAAAAAGDTIITRRNNRKIPITAIDWVKNGDRWMVNAVLESGSLNVTHLRTGRHITLPADYVREHVSLGYACTVHGAQGITADTCHVVGSGDESRQLLYVAMTRGRHANHVYLTTAGDGDEHSIIKPDTLLPPTAGDILARILARNAAPVSATSTGRSLADPLTALQSAADRFHHALATAAEDRLGPDGIAAIDTAGETYLRGLTRADAWPALRAHLALLAADGHDPADMLIHAAAQGDLGNARDTAAVLEWRLDPRGTHSSTTGPLPWLPGIPTTLSADNGWSSYLAQRAQRVADLADQVHEQARAWTPTSAPEWAQPLLDRDRDLVVDLAVWRAANSVEDNDRRPTGPPLPSAADTRAQRALNERVSAVLGDPRAATTRWATLANGLDERLTKDPYWPVLAERLTAAERAGIDITTLTRRVADDKPLPDEQPAAALWWRLSAHLSPAAVTGRDHSGTESLRPGWTPVLADVLGEDAAARVIADPAWPSLVAAVTHARTAGWTPDQILDTAHELLVGGQPDDEPLRDSELATALVWRTAILTEHTDLAAAPRDAGTATSTSTAAVDEQAIAELEPLAEVAHAADEDWLASLVEPDLEHELVPPDPDSTEPAGEDIPLATTPSAAHTHWVTEDDEHGALYQYPSRDGIQRERLVALNQQAADFYSDRYPNSWAAAYLADRLGTDLAGDPRFGIGYAPDRWDTLTNHLRDHGASDAELIAAGLAVRTDSGRLRDRFRDRLIFPITAEAPDGSIEIHGFIGRRNPTKSDEDRCGPKYLNTAETDLFHKGHEMYGMADHHAALTAGAQPVLVEGPVDAIAVTLAGDGRYVGVAPLGIAFTDVQADRLRPYRDAPVIVATDADTAGQQAAYRAFWHLAARGHNPAHVLVPHGKDPAELYQTSGPATLLAALDSSGCLGDHVIAMRTEPLADRLDTVEGRVHALRRAAQVVVALPPDQWADQARTLAQQLGIDEHVAIREVIDATTTWDADPHAAARSHAGERLPALPPPTVEPLEPAQRWASLASRIAPDLASSPDWPTLAAYLDRAAATGFNVESRLPLFTVDRPLDPRHPARDLSFRLIDAWSDCLPPTDAAAAADNRRHTEDASRAQHAAANRLRANQQTSAAESGARPVQPPGPSHDQPPHFAAPTPDHRQGPRR